MARPQTYRNSEGKRVPSVTTALSQLGWGKDGLLYWANSQGLEGRTLAEARESVAGPGKVAHAMIEAHYRGEPTPDLSRIDPDVRRKAEKAFENFMRSGSGEIRDLLSVETPLVSDAHGYGGTHDLVYRSDYDIVLRDTKTGNGLYLEALLQVAAYGQLWNEHHPDQPITVYELHRIHNESTTVVSSQVMAQDMGRPWEAFRIALRLYHLQREMKGLV